jgi:hypothetical protein
VTKEILTFALIYLVVLVLLLFAFIFVGISAFAVPGTFGSIVNSAFPMGNLIQLKIIFSWWRGSNFSKKA